MSKITEHELINLISEQINQTIKEKYLPTDEYSIGNINIIFSRYKLGRFVDNKVVAYNPTIIKILKQNIKNGKNIN